MLRVILIAACAVTFLGASAPARGEDDDGIVRIAILAHVHVALIERCGYAKGTDYEDLAYSLVDNLKPYLSPEDFAGAGQVALMMDLTCSEENYHVRRLLRAAEKFNDSRTP